MEHNRRDIRNLSIMLVFLLACSAGLYLAGEYSGEANADIFMIPADVTVDEVELKNGKRSVRLLGNASGWSIGDSVRASQDRVRVLFAALDRMKPGRAPARKDRDSILSVLKQSGIEVKLKAGGDEVLTFVAVGNEDRQETWLSDPDGREIWRMSIPGYSTYLMDIFTPSSDSWRDTRLFNLNWRNFSGYSAQFPGRPSDDFAVAQQDGVFSVTGLAATDTSRLNSYLDAVSLMTAGTMTLPDAEKLSVLMKTPVQAVLEVREVSGNTFRISVMATGEIMVQPRPGRYLLAQVSPAQRRILTLPKSHFRRQN